MAKFIQVSAKPERGIWRAGRKWTREAQKFPAGYIPPKVLDVLKADPDLTVSEVEPELEDKKRSNPPPPPPPPGGDQTGTGAKQEPTREERIDAALAEIIKADPKAKKPSQKDVEAVVRGTLPADAPKFDITKAELDAAWERATKKE